MVLYTKDGITVQALSSQEEAEYKRLGFTQVEDVKPKLQKKDASKDAPAEKAVE